MRDIIGYGAADWRNCEQPSKQEENEQPERLVSHFLISQNWVNKTALRALSDFANAQRVAAIISTH